MDAVYSSLARLLNRGIRESATAAGLCRELAGRSLSLTLDPPGARLRLTATATGLQVGPDQEPPADAQLTGGLFGFLALGLGEAEDTLRARRVQLAGDTDTAEAFQRLLVLARPDPEEELSKLVGDVAAHQLGEAARGLAGWAREAARSLGRSLTEYLQEERRDLPTRVELDEFLTAVDTLASDVDRAAARLARLAGRDGA